MLLPLPLEGLATVDVGGMIDAQVSPFSEVHLQGEAAPSEASEPRYAPMVPIDSSDPDKTILRDADPIHATHDAAGRDGESGL